MLLTSYWTSTPYGTNGVYRVATGGGLSNPSQSTLSYFGVRPVVTISIDSI